MQNESKCQIAALQIRNLYESRQRIKTVRDVQTAFVRAFYWWKQQSADPPTHLAAQNKSSVAVQTKLMSSDITGLQQKMELSQQALSEYRLRDHQRLQHQRVEEECERHQRSQQYQSMMQEMEDLRQKLSDATRASQEREKDFHIQMEESVQRCKELEISKQDLTQELNSAQLELQKERDAHYEQSLNKSMEADELQQAVWDLETEVEELRPLEAEVLVLRKRCADLDALVASRTQSQRVERAPATAEPISQPGATAQQPTSSETADKLSKIEIAEKVRAEVAAESAITVERLQREVATLRVQLDTDRKRIRTVSEHAARTLQATESREAAVTAELEEARKEVQQERANVKTLTIGNDIAKTEIESISQAALTRYNAACTSWSHQEQEMQQQIANQSKHAETLSQELTEANEALSRATHSLEAVSDEAEHQRELSDEVRCC